MFHVFTSTEGKNIRKQLFLETINSPRCTVRSLLKHSKVAHEIAKDKRFGSVSEMKEIVLKRWPHLKHVVKEMHFMATEARSKPTGRPSLNIVARYRRRWGGSYLSNLIQGENVQARLGLLLR